MSDAATRAVLYAATLAGDYSGTLPTPQTKLEHYLYRLATEGLSASGSVSKSDIAEAVANYLAANPVTVETADTVEEGNTLPVTSGGVYTYIDAAIGDIEAALAEI